jgi:hypothetical protein
LASSVAKAALACSICRWYWFCCWSSGTPCPWPTRRACPTLAGGQLLAGLLERRVNLLDDPLGLVRVGALAVIETFSVRPVELGVDGLPQALIVYFLLELAGRHAEHLVPADLLHLGADDVAELAGWPPPWEVVRASVPSWRIENLAVLV